MGDGHVRWSTGHGSKKMVDVRQAEAEPVVLVAKVVHHVMAPQAAEVPPFRHIPAHVGSKAVAFYDAGVAAP